MSHIGKLDGRCTDLPTKEHNRALMNGDPWITDVREDKKETKSRNSRYVTDYRKLLELKACNLLICVCGCNT